MFRYAVTLRRATAALPFAVLLASCAAQAVPATTVQAPSTLVQAALESVGHAGSAVDLNRWKGPNALREEVDGNLASMQKDLQNTLPALLSAADAAPVVTRGCAAGPVEPGRAL